jgi:DNA polymerase III psi subunit
LAGIAPCQVYAEKIERPVDYIQEELGKQIFLTNKTVKVRFGKTAGYLYTFMYPPTSAFNSWFFSNETRIIIVDQRKYADEVMVHDVKSIFNIRRNNSYCLVYIKLNYLPQPYVIDKKWFYDGDVYCRAGGRAVRDNVLSSRLKGIKTAAQARMALAPYL